MKESPTFLLTYMSRKLAGLLIRIALLILVAALALIVVINAPGNRPVHFGYPLIAMMGMSIYFWIVYSEFQEIVVLIDKILFFDKFKGKTASKIRKLGGNPEELDKEESASK